MDDITGIVAHVRKCSRTTTYVQLRGAGGELLDVLCKSAAVSGGLLSDEVHKSLRVQLRAGDECTVAVGLREQRGERADLLHASSVTITAMRFASNTAAPPQMIKPPSTAARQEEDGAADDDSGGEEAFHAQFQRAAGLHEGGSAGVPQGDGPHHEGAGQHCSERVRVFGEWLLARLRGHAAWADGGAPRVVEVAGGRGELSFFLQLHGVRCCLVDPRPTSGMLTRRQRKMLRKSGASHFEVVREEFGADAALTARLLSGADLCIGLHPDEATEAIVDGAIAHATPFAVVPCCVFSRLFPRLLGSTPVRTLEQFIAYLRAKSGSAATADLGFEGRSVVVFDVARPPAAGHEDELRCGPCEEPS